MKRILLTMMLAMVTVGAPAAESPAFQHPVLRVPRMSSPPNLDGIFVEGEWREAAAFTGLSGNPLGKPFLLPEAQQVTWYLGWHGDMIYLGMKSPHPQGTFPVGRIKENDDPDILWGDHTEIQICPHARGDASRPGKGFYKLITNAWSALQDTHYYNGTPGTEDLWSCGGEVKSHVTDSMWTMEMSMDARQMQLRKLDGAELIVQLVRAADTGGIYYAGWVGKSWMAWDDFASCIFDPYAPVIQFTRLGEVMEGRLDAAFTLTAVEKPRDIKVEVSIENADGKAVYQEARSVSLAAGESQELLFSSVDIPLTEVDIDGQRNHLEIRATYMDGKAERVLYHNRSSMMKMTPAWRAKYWDPWVNTRPQAGDWQADFAYLPYSQRLSAKVDTDFFGMTDDIRQASRFQVSVRDKASGSELLSSAAELTKGAGELFVETPDLADGEYQVVFTLIGPDGTAKVGEQLFDFVRKRYPWEHNRLGYTDKVIPPYTPMAVNPRIIVGGGPAGRYYMGFDNKPGTYLHAWGRVYQLAANGLLEQIWATPPTGTAGRVETLLAAPMRLEAKLAGETQVLEGTGFTLTRESETRMDVEGGAAGSGIRVATTAYEEFDGWYQVELAVSPEAGAVEVEALDLVVDLRDVTGDRQNPVFPVDTLYTQRLGIGKDSFYGGIDRKPGLAFTSSSLFSPGARTGPADVIKDWKSFLPITYVGNGDRGLWFFAWSDTGWTLDEEDSAVRVERLADGNVRLRVRFISGPDQLDAVRRIRFAVQAAPIKQNDVEYRTRLSRIMHDTSGYRYYGDSVDSFSLHTEEDYAKLREYLLHGTRYQEHDKGSRYGHWEGRLGKLLREGRADRVMMYGSQWMTGLGAEEFDSFGGEWLGKSNWEPNPDLKFADKWNYGHTVKWHSPRELTASRVNWPQSMADFFVWYHERLIDKSGFNGTWWDNCYSGTVTEYDPELDRLDAKWNVPYRRELCKRLNVVGWEHMRPPCWSMNTQVDMAWCQVFWLVEGDWGQSAPDITIQEQFGSMGWARSQIRTKSTTMVAKTSYISHFKGNTPETDRQCKRSADGLMLSHDIPPVNNTELIHQLKYVVDYANTDACFFMGYWGTGAFVQPAGREVHVSAYQNPSRGAAVLVFYNGLKRDQYLGGTTIDAAGVTRTSSWQPMEADRAVDIARVYDLESGQAVRTAFRDGRLAIDEPYVLKAHEYRVLVLQAN